MYYVVISGAGRRKEQEVYVCRCGPVSVKDGSRALQRVVGAAFPSVSKPRYTGSVCRECRLMYTLSVAVEQWRKQCCDDVVC